MNSILLYPSYFPCIVQLVAIAQADEVIFEVEDNYQKQTYRNRTYIAHSNGRLLLNVPIKHTKDGNRQKTKDVKIENAFPWQNEHWKSIQTAYRTSPFFEYYEDELEPLFTLEATHLLAHNKLVFEKLYELIGLETKISESKTYEKDPAIKDLRNLINAKSDQVYDLQSYTQVLQSHHGYLPNLSVLDLLCNEGPNTLNYLESQEIEFL